MVQDWRSIAFYGCGPLYHENGKIRSQTKVKDGKIWSGSRNGMKTVLFWALNSKANLIETNDLQNSLD